MKKIRLVIAILFLGFIHFMTYAQPDPRENGNGSGVGTTPVGGGPSGAPIDGGLGILLALAAGYGSYKMRSLKEKELQG
jgi:hypothetical protein